MYYIIGADGQQYGPVTAAQIRQWLGERRLHAQSLVRVDGSTEWKTLAATPEFLADFQTIPPIPPPPGYVPAYPSDPRASSKIPAGVCGILLGSLGVHKFILGYTGAGLAMLLVTLLSCLCLAPLVHLIGIIEGIIYLTKPDPEFVRQYVEGRRSWF